jgi:signal transduction histidine kinase
MAERRDKPCDRKPASLLRTGLLKLDQAFENWLGQRGGRRLSLVGAVLIAITILASAAAIWDLRRDAIADFRGDITNTAALLGEETSRSMQAVDLVLREVQARAEATGARRPEEFAGLMATEEVHDFLVDRLKSLPQADAVNLVGADGRLLNFSRGWPIPAIDLSDREHYRHFRDHDDPGTFIAEPVKNRATGGWTIFLARRVSGPDGEFLGVVLGVIAVDYLEAFYKAITLQPGGSVTLLRRDGMILARYPHTENIMATRMPGQSPWYQRVAENGGSYDSPGYLDGIVRVVAVQPVRDYPLVVDITISQDEALANWRRQSAFIAIAALGATIGFAVLFRALAAQFRRLERSEARLAAQNSELEASRALLQEQTAELVETATALRTSETRFRDYALASSDWFWEQDAELRFSSFADVSRGPGPYLDHIGRKRWEVGANGVSAEQWAAHKADLAARRPFRDFRYERIGRDGKNHVFSISGNPVFDENGVFVGYRGNGRDVTAMVEMEVETRRKSTILQAMLDHFPAGVSIMDHELNVIMFNQRFLELLEFPAERFQPGDPLEKFFRYNAARGEYGAGDEEEQVRERLDLARQFRPHRFERARPNGMTLEIQGNPLPGLGFVTTYADMTSHKRNERTLHAAVEQAQLANRTKSEFLANMSHELRTPLNAIIGFSEIIRDGRFGAIAPRYAEYAGDINASGRHLLDLINDVLDMSKIEAGRYELNEERCALGDLVRAGITMVATRAEQGAVRIDSAAALGEVALFADARAVKQIVLNLLTNAVKFTPSGGRVAIEVERMPSGALALCVTDTGIGIEEEVIRHLSEPFRQADASIARKFGGTGLGLAICRKLMALHEGMLAIESGRGRGTTVRAIFPSERILALPRPIAATVAS